HQAGDQVQARLSLIAGETRRQYELHLCALMSFARGSKRGGAVDSAPAGRTLRTDFRLRRGTYSSSSSVSSSSSLPPPSWNSTPVSSEMESKPDWNIDLTLSSMPKPKTAPTMAAINRTIAPYSMKPAPRSALFSRRFAMKSEVLVRRETRGFIISTPSAFRRFIRWAPALATFINLWGRASGRLGPGDPTSRGGGSQEFLGP